jgi:hypothetical protein
MHLMPQRTSILRTERHPTLAAVLQITLGTVTLHNLLFPAMAAPRLSHFVKGTDEEVQFVVVGALELVAELEFLQEQGWLVLAAAHVLLEVLDAGDLALFAVGAGHWEGESVGKGVFPRVAAFSGAGDYLGVVRTPEGCTFSTGE